MLNKPSIISGRIEGGNLTFILDVFDYGQQVGFAVIPSSADGPCHSDAEKYRACSWGRNANAYEVADSLEKLAAALREAYAS